MSIASPTIKMMRLKDAPPFRQGEALQTRPVS